ncbi:MAG: metalloprotease PmbA [Gammaproteobacteria bacterium]|nr:metalloprotease PmbA [Gammaproteobacteria bacterium]
MSEPQAIPHSVDELEAIVQKVLDLSADRGATSAEAAVSSDTGLSVTARLGEVETLEYHKDQGVGVTVYFGQRKGSSSSSDLRPEALAEAVEAACRIARYTEEDECAGLADAELMAYDYPDLELDYPWDIDAEAAVELAKQTEASAMELDERITNSDGGSVNAFRGASVYGNSHGFVGGYSSTRHSMSCSVIGEADGLMQRDYWYSVSRDPSKLEPPEQIGRLAAERTLHRLGARQISTRQAPIIFAADIARSFIGHFVGAIRGSAQYRKASFLLDHLGQQIFPEEIHIHEQPYIHGGLGSAPFDSEGVKTREKDMIANGVLQSYVLDSYSARKLGMQTTGNAGGVRNLTVDSTAGDLQSIMQGMGTGLLVTELIGHGINMVTGDYSRGASGFWIENGEVAYPVEEITIAGNLKNMFMGIQAVGSDTDNRGSIRTGSILIDQMTIAGE